MKGMILLWNFDNIFLKTINEIFKMPKSVFQNISFQ